MRVICIENSLWCDGPYQGQVCIHKGSVYHVTGSVDAEQIKQAGIPAAPGTWYSLLEVEGVHHYIRFLEIPEDDNEEVSEEYVSIATRNIN